MAKNYDANDRKKKAKARMEKHHGLLRNEGGMSNRERYPDLTARSGHKKNDRKK